MRSGWTRRGPALLQSVQFRKAAWLPSGPEPQARRSPHPGPSQSWVFQLPLPAKDPSLYLGANLHPQQHA